MTIDERADKVAKELTRQYLGSGAVVINLGEYEEARKAILAAMMDAVAEKREACAVIAEQWDRRPPLADICAHIAATIRNCG